MTAPASIGKYDILRLLGQGGMGEVYLARHRHLGVRRALKVMRKELSDSLDFRAQFANEAKVLAALRHPKIVQIHDLEIDEDLCYIDMDFVSPDDENVVTIGDLLDRNNGRLHHEQMAGLFGQVCEAISFAHSRDIIHRDIKPANILLDRHDTIRVSDFGLAEIAAEQVIRQSIAASVGCDLSRVATGRRPGVGEEISLGAQASVAGNVSAAWRTVGTSHFMPPEVLAGGEWSRQGDIYSLGVLAYFMLTGQYPVGAYALPNGFDSATPIVWDALIERMLQQNAMRRPQTVNEIIEELVEEYPFVGAGGAAKFRQTSAGEIPDSAFRMLREFIAKNHAKWDDALWHKFTIDFYRYPGHDPVTEEQLTRLAREQKEQWLEREATRMEEAAAKAREAASKLQQAEEARRRADAVRQAKPLRESGEGALKAGNFDEAVRLLSQAYELLPDDPDLARLETKARDSCVKYHMDIARRQRDTYEFSKAIDELEIIRIIPRLGTSQEASDLLNDIQQTQTRIATALKQAEQQLHDDNEIAFASVNEVLRLSPREPRALKLKDEIENANSSCHNLVQKADKLARCLRYDEAIASLSEASKLRPKNKQIVEKLTALKAKVASVPELIEEAALAMGEKRFHIAAAAARSALEISPHSLKAQIVLRKAVICYRVRTILLLLATALPYVLLWILIPVLHHRMFFRDFSFMAVCIFISLVAGSVLGIFASLASRERNENKAGVGVLFGLLLPVALSRPADYLAGFLPRLHLFEPQVIPYYASTLVCLATISMATLLIRKFPHSWNRVLWIGVAVLFVAASIPTADFIFANPR